MKASIQDSFAVNSCGHRRRALSPEANKFNSSTTSRLCPPPDFPPTFHRRTRFKTAGPVSGGVKSTEYRYCRFRFDTSFSVTHETKVTDVMMLPPSSRSSFRLYGPPLYQAAHPPLLSRELYEGKPRYVLSVYLILVLLAQRALFTYRQHLSFSRTPHPPNRSRTVGLASRDIFSKDSGMSFLHSIPLHFT